MGPFSNDRGCTPWDDTIATRDFISELDCYTVLLGAFAPDMELERNRQSLSSRSPIVYVASPDGTFVERHAGARSGDGQGKKYVATRAQLRDPAMRSVLRQRAPGTDDVDLEKIGMHFEMDLEVCLSEGDEFDIARTLIDSAAFRSTMSWSQAFCLGFPADKPLLKPGDEGFGAWTMRCAHGDPVTGHYGPFEVMFARPESGDEMRVFKVTMLILPNEMFRGIPPTVLGRDAIFHHRLDLLI